MALHINTLLIKPDDIGLVTGTQLVEEPNEPTPIGAFIINICGWFIEISFLIDNFLYQRNKFRLNSFLWFCTFSFIKLALLLFTYFVVSYALTIVAE